MNDFLQQIGVGPRSPHDPFFGDSYKVCKIFARKGVTIIDDEELCHETVTEFPCNALGCTETFQSLLDFEVHYDGSHRYICSECKKRRPSARLLDIHIQENHDSFFKVLAERQPMYQCYVSECNLKFKTPSERREHCGTVHKYPKHFRFDEERCAKTKYKPRNQMEVDKGPQSIKPKIAPARLNKNHKSKAFYPVDKQTQSENMTAGIIPSASEIRTPVSQNSALTFIPRQVKSYSKLLSKTESSPKDVLNNGCMMDLGTSLPD